MNYEDMLYSILSLIAADGKIDEQERQFFDKMCHEFQISQEAKDSLIHRMKQGRGTIQLPDEEEDQRQLLAFLTQAAFADGVLEAKEQAILQTVTRKMSLSPTVLDDLIAAMHTEIQTTPVQEEMICPQCGEKQVQALRCRQCGVFIKNFLKKRERQALRASAPPTQPDVQPPSENTELLTKRIGGELSGFTARNKCSWPLGTLTMYQYALRIDMVLKSYLLEYTNIERINTFLLTVRIHHDDPSVPKHVRLNGYHLYSAIQETNDRYDLGLPIG